MVTCGDIRDVIVGTVFTFKTPRLVRVRSFKIGLIFRLVQLVILTYLIGYAIIYKREYQEWDKAESSVTAKVKGIASTKDRQDLPRLYRRIWDTADYVIPPHENGAFFVMTNAVMSPNQSLSECAEDPSVSPCSPTGNNCTAGQIHPRGSGVMTGRCIQYNPRSNRRYSCEVSGWCPLERDNINWTKPMLTQAVNFTVFIKNSIEFAKFNKKRSNILPDSTVDYLKRCLHSEEDKFCPIFTLGYMTNAAGANFTKLAYKGGVISIGIEWDCDLDYDISNCMPVYKFGQLDDESTNASKGWNFRYANYYRTVNGVEYRDLVKAYGILFIFTVNGKAGRFSIVKLLIAIGSGVALLGIATLACDFILMYIVKMRQEYQQRKFLELMDEDFKKITAVEKDPENGDGAPQARTRTSITPRQSFEK